MPGNENILSVVFNPTIGEATLRFHQIDPATFPAYAFHRKEAASVGINFNEATGVYAAAIPFCTASVLLADDVASELGETKVHVTGVAVEGAGATLLLTDGETLDQSAMLISRDQGLRTLEIR